MSNKFGKAHAIIASFFLSLCCILGTNSLAQTVSGKPVMVKPSDVYAAINVDTMNQTIAILDKGRKKERKKLIEEIKANSQNYAPPVFYALSARLYKDKHKEEAAFWFYAGQLRGRFDANRCTDQTAGAAISTLNQEYGAKINQYMFKKLPDLEALIPKVVAWDRSTPYNYDHRWINLHGMIAMMTSMIAELPNDGSGKPPPPLPALSFPENQWDDIAEKTRTDYLDSFLKALQQMKK